MLQKKWKQGDYASRALPHTEYNLANAESRRKNYWQMCVHVYMLVVLMFKDWIYTYLTKAGYP